MAKIIEFTPALRLLHRKPKPQPEEPVEFVQMPAADLLKQVLEDNAQAASITDVVILVRDNTGECAFFSNLDDPAENLLFMEQIKTKLVDATLPKGTPTPPRLA